MKKSGFLLILLAFVAEPVLAQSFTRTLKDTALDPTTYAPGIISYTAKKLDWDSSQIFFDNGYVEANKYFTVSGLSNDTPVSHREGLRRIRRMSLEITAGQAINNFSASLLKQYFEKKFPNKKGLIKSLYWAEKISVSFCQSYSFSKNNFRAWRNNVRTAENLGFK